MKYISHHMSQNAHLIINSGEMASKQAAKMHGRLIQGQESMATNSGEEGRWTFSFWGFHLGWSDWEKEAVTTKDQWLFMRHRSIWNFIRMYLWGVFLVILNSTWWILLILHSALGNFLSLFCSFLLLSFLCFPFLGLLLIWFWTFQIYHIFFLIFWCFCLFLLDVTGVLLFSNHL